MKVFKLQLFVLVFAVVTGQLATGETSQENGIDNEQANTKVKDGNLQFYKVSNRFKRQTSTTTTPKPKKNRPSNLFSLISVLISETREDTNRAFNEIGTLFNSQFADNNATTKKEMMTTTTTPPSPSSTSDGDEDSEDNEITTTTESFRISRNEFLGILRSNVQGLVQLFGKEFRVAIKDSNQNVREFGRDLGTALRPYFT